MRSRILGLLVLMGIAVSLPLQAEESTENKIAVESGQKIAFMGDSITAAGARPGGYCQLILSGLKAEGVEASGIFAGKSGHKSNQMLARLEKDVISKKPDWMTLSCGVNDVWHGARGVELEDYKKNITEIIEKAQAADIKVMVLTSTMIKEDQKNTLNQKLLGYNAALKELAEAKGCLFADLNTEMQEALKTFPPDAPKGKQLTGDGVHMNPYGNMMMAKGVLKAFGITEDQLVETEKSWKSAPDTKNIRLTVKMSIADYEAIQATNDKTPEKLFQEFLDEKKSELVKEPENDQKPNSQD